MLLNADVPELVGNAGAFELIVAVNAEVFDPNKDGCWG